MVVQSRVIFLIDLQNLVMNDPLTAFKKTIDFVIQGTAMKHPNSRAIIKLYCKKCIHKNTILG